MTQKKGEFRKIVLEYICFIVIILQVLLLIWITGKFLEKKWQEKENIRLEKIAIQKELEALKQKKLQEKIDYENYIKTLDLDSDNSLTKFVNNKVAYDNIWYIPDMFSSDWN